VLLRIIYQTCVVTNHVLLPDTCCYKPRVFVTCCYVARLVAWHVSSVTCNISRVVTWHVLLVSRVATYHLSDVSLSIRCCCPTRVVTSHVLLRGTPRCLTRVKRHM